MNKLTASNLVSFIGQLDRNVSYHYINPKTKGLIQIVEVQRPEGPISIKRWNPIKGKTSNESKVESISTEMIWRLANAFIPNHPINVDRIFGGSYNTRSVLEALIAHTPQFYFCYPGRLESMGGTTTIEHGHKHLIWQPSNPHQIGRIYESKSDMVISEVPTMEVYYDSLKLPDYIEKPDLGIDVQRTHSLMQVALYTIGLQLGFRTWIAQNDKGILYKNKRLAESEGIIASLKDEKLISSHDDAIRAALLIDCIWFKNGRLMPAVMEVEHSTGVTSGLTRMLNFKEKFPPFPTRYVIVAADEDREKVIKEANKPQFQSLNTRFFPYSAVKELCALCQKRKLKGITEEFLDCYMEPVLS